jgi:predicted glycosyltransferase
VPDFFRSPDLAGELSHPKLQPNIPLKYIGPLSRFENAEQKKIFDICIIISGPEPQRTIFEEVLLKQIKDYPGKIAFVRGLPEQDEVKLSENGNIEFKDHLPAKELNELLLQSSIFVGRSGYSTVMDLVKLQLPGILIPTPGQTEQEYLGKYLMTKQMFYCVEQNKFSLKKALQAAAQFRFRIPNVSLDQYKVAVNEFVKKINS